MKIKKNKFWNEAKKIIPGGNMIFSKRSEMFLPDYWPAYFSKSKNCFVWDNSGNKFIDMLFAVGTNVLGYNNTNVNKAVAKVIQKGNMTSLNSYEEVILSKKLLKINKWANMIKYSRSGGEANAIAIRIARAYQKKSNVAVCGYHGWHDWYLSMNIKSKNNLNYHLNKGVDIDGVPKELKDTCFAFRYGDIKKLEFLLKNKKIGIIKMEVERNYHPSNKKFLQDVKKLSKKYKTLLIFDECTSGFRQSIGGLHLEYKVFPDMVIYGKALGNGYAINAILGKKKIMQKAQQSFISSTFWSERIGFVAAIKTIDEMKRKKSWIYIKKTGERIKAKWMEISKKYNVPIVIGGISAIPSFQFKTNHQIKKTYFTQEMLKKGFLASNIIYVSLAHKNKILEKYFSELEKVFFKISKIKNLKKELVGKISHSTFQRLN
jgi:glutamate-1-semialdehyde 2,1-aminomutase